TNLTISTSVTLKERGVASVFGVGLFNGTPQMRLVVAQTNGIPGWPGTGSDPKPQPDSSQRLVPWLLAALIVVGIGGGVAIFGLTVLQEGADIQTGNAARSRLRLRRHPVCEESATKVRI